MSKPSDHIHPGALCVVCRLEPATFVTRLVTRDDDMPQDGLVYAGATCFRCAQRLGDLLKQITAAKPADTTCEACGGEADIATCATAVPISARGKESFGEAGKTCSVNAVCLECMVEAGSLIDVVGKRGLPG